MSAFPQFKISVADIQREVAELYGLPLSIMSEPDGSLGSRETKHARPRQVAMYLSRRLCSNGGQKQYGRAAITAIGRKFGGRDHTTVLHACRTIERFMLADTEERRAVGQVALKFIEENEHA